MSVEWIPFPDDRFVVHGLWWWEETAPKLQRLPDRMKERVREPVWNLAQAPSGARIRFATDATALGIRLHYPSLTYMNNMPRVGQLGVGLWVNGEYWRPIIPTDSNEVEEMFFENMPAERREICLHLGLYGPVQIQAIGLSEGAEVEPPAPFAVDKPVTYYGSSITQGACATHSGMSYQAIVGRALNVDFVNLGFSGNGVGEPEMAEAMAEVDASCYVVDFCQNCPTAEYLRDVYAPFLRIIRESRPETPIICVTPIFSLSEVWGGTTRLADMRMYIREAVAERREIGDERIALVEGYEMLGPDDRVGLVDASHPNDIGFTAMARGIESALREALGL